MSYDPILETIKRYQKDERKAIQSALKEVLIVGNFVTKSDLKLAAKNVQRVLLEREDG